MFSRGSAWDDLQVLQRQILAGGPVREPEEAAGRGAEAERRQPEEPRLVPRALTLGGLHAHTHTHTHVDAHSRTLMTQLLIHPDCFDMSGAVLEECSLI